MRAWPGLLAIMAAAPLGGCGPPVTAPPLTIRPVEGRPIALPQADPSEIEVPADPALLTRIRPLLAMAEEGDRAFAAARRQAESAVMAAAGAPREGEAWTTAQQALSALEAARGGVRDAANGIESMRQDPANRGSGDRAAIGAAATRIEAMEEAEAAITAALAARLR